MVVGRKSNKERVSVCITVKKIKINTCHVVRALVGTELKDCWILDHVFFSLFTLRSNVWSAMFRHETMVRSLKSLWLHIRGRNGNDAIIFFTDIVNNNVKLYNLTNLWTIGSDAPTHVPAEMMLSLLGLTYTPIMVLCNAHREVPMFIWFICYRTAH